MARTIGSDGEKTQAAIHTAARRLIAKVGDEAQGADTQTAPKGSETAGVTKSPVFPSAVSSKFAAEKPARARMHTCLEQYHINKDNNTLGGMRWIEKGGGYYKLCNARLKGTT